MSGGVSDVDIWDCDMGKSMCGIGIKAAKSRRQTISMQCCESISLKRIKCL